MPRFRGFRALRGEKCGLTFADRVSLIVARFSTFLASPPQTAKGTPELGQESAGQRDRPQRKARATARGGRTDVIVPGRQGLAAVAGGTFRLARGQRRIIGPSVRP